MKGYYRHKKGNLYRVLYEAKDSETCETLIVYQAMYGKGEVWVRPKEMFFEEGRFQYVEESEALKLIPIELNPKYRFPDIEYTATKVPLIGKDEFSKNVKAMITLRGKEEEFKKLGIKNDDNLEEHIIHRIKAYRPGGNLEDIFHLIQIWGGNSGRGIYLFGDGFNWKEIDSHYQRLVDACLSMKDVTEETVDMLVEAVREFNRLVKHMNVAFITKHTRYWLCRTLDENALPIYDSIMANYVMQRNVNIKDLREYWDVMLAKAKQQGIGLVPLERHIFKYAYETQNGRKY